MTKKIDYNNEAEIILRADTMFKSFEVVCDAIHYNLEEDEEYRNIIKTIVDIEEGEIIFSTIVATYLLNTIKSYITNTSKEFIK